jgi:iron complex transport system permease protein
MDVPKNSPDLSASSDPGSLSDASGGELLGPPGVPKKTLLFLFLLPTVLFFVSFAIGRYPIPLPTVLKIFASRVLPLSPDWESSMETVLFRLRLPRIAAAMLVGAGLSLSGAAFQGVFRNPLVSPYLLGVASGAGFGAALAILLSESLFVLQFSALLFGILAVALTFGIGRFYRGAPTLVLILGGVIVGAFFSSLTSLIKFVADPYEKLPAIVFWLMGSMARVTPENLRAVGPFIGGGTLLLLLLGWRLNILSMGDEEAKAMGVNAGRERAMILTICTLVTASSVCLSGIIGWVGLVIPHVGRILVGPDHRRLLPACLALGSTFLLLVDNCARAATAMEIPLGILTALVGAPLFAWMLSRKKVGW